MPKSLPPVPPAGRAKKGPGAAPEGTRQADLEVRENRPVPNNLAEQDRQGNTKQNTTNQGYQQDR